MKDQRSSATTTTVLVNESEDENLPPKKPVDCQDLTIKIESDGDSGIVNSTSNNSLDRCDEIISEHPNKNNNDDYKINKNINNNNNEKSEISGQLPSWELKIPPISDPITLEYIRDVVLSVRSEMNEIREEDRKKWIVDRLTKSYGDKFPRSLLEIVAADNFDGDTGISMDVKPEWLDMEKFRRGQKVALDHYFAISYAEVMSLMVVFSFENGLKPLITTDASSTPYTSFKRYLSTASRILNWYSSDPWTPNTPAYNDLRTVRKMHAMVRKKLESISSDEFIEKSTIKDAWCPTLNILRNDFQATCPAPAPGQCPYNVLKKYPDIRTKMLNQGEMASTQMAFVGLFVLYPKSFGAHDATEEDLEAFCYVWRAFGYLLGIDDEFNFCRGTLEDVRARTRDFINVWAKPNFRDIQPEWEHMMRCIFEGLQYYYPGSTFETTLLDLAEIMNLHMPRLYNSLSYVTWIKHHVIKFYFNHASKIPGLRSIMNRQVLQAIEKAKKYEEKKHLELQEKSEKTLNSYLIGSKKKTVSTTESSE